MPASATAGTNCDSYGGAHKSYCAAQKKKNPNEFDIYMSVHRNIVPNYSQQDATFFDLFIFTGALHVLGGSSAHHQEHITVHTASGTVIQYCC